MSAPILTKLWQFDVNQLVLPDTASSTAKLVLYSIKESLVGFASSPWEVWGSCDGAGGGGSFGNGDAVDRWADPTVDLVSGAEGANHSWIVLSQPGLGNNAAICINYIGSLVAQWVLSPSLGFGVANGGADGTATARPTAADEVVLHQASSVQIIVTVSGYQHRLHVMQSTDGECTRFFVQSSGSAGRSNTGFGLVEKARNPIGWANPVFGTVFGNNGNHCPSIVQLATYGSASSAAFRTRINGDVVVLTVVSEGSDTELLQASTTLATGPNDETVEWPLYGAGLLSPYSHRGLKGEFYDMWVGQQVRTTGTMYPSDGSCRFAQIYSIVVPWNGTVMHTS